MPDLIDSLLLLTSITRQWFEDESWIIVGRLRKAKFLTGLAACIHWGVLEYLYELILFGWLFQLLYQVEFRVIEVKSAGGRKGIRISLSWLFQPLHRVEFWVIELIKLPAATEQEHFEFRTS